MAYALVVSLKQTLEPLLDSGRSRIQIPNSDLKLIYDDLCNLKSFFDRMNSLEDSDRVEELEKEIKFAVKSIRDLIESHLSVLVHSPSVSSIPEFPRKLVEVKDKLGSLIQTLKAADEEYFLTGDQQPPDSLQAEADTVSPAVDFGRNEQIVGLEDEVTMLQRRLIRGNPKLKVISIVGMGGIGKTALAKEVYLNPHVMRYFAVRLFVRVDLECELEELLLCLLDQLVSMERKGRTAHELGDELSKYLFKRRYLIVLDGVWDTRAWDRLQRFFPDDRNGSRVIWTTRLANVARGTCTEENILQKRFLNDAESWDLLQKTAFSDKKECPLEIEEIGKEIAVNLEGLPLAIVKTGELLSDLPATVQNWKEMARNMDSFLHMEIIPKILNPSYTQLPHHLKACFLYMGVFHPGHDIHTSQLIRLWVAEGFIEPVADKSLEKKAEEYLGDLVSRGLVIAGKLSSTGRLKTCRIHLVLHYLCISAARQEKLFHIVKEGTTSSPQGTEKKRRLAVHSNDLLGFKHVQSLMKSESGARSLLCVDPHHQHPLQQYLGFDLLRVLHALPIRFGEFPDQVPKLSRLRYLAITYDGEVPPSISALWNLEVLIIHRSQGIKSPMLLPLEIWKLHKLMHLECIGFDLPDPCVGNGCGDSLFLKKLLTLSGVSAQSCTDKVLARTPNLIKLEVWFEPTNHAVENFCKDDVFIQLRHLGSFKCVVMNPGLPSRAASSLTVFPSDLTKLTLSGCGFPWKLMARIGALPNLQVLKLRKQAFSGPKWKIQDNHFHSLKYLMLEDLDMQKLIVHSYNIFPCLEYLLLQRCYKLKKIPTEIGDILTLQVLEVNDCSMSVIESARFIQEEQKEIGNDGLKLLIHSSTW